LRPPGKVVLAVPVLILLYFYGLAATGMLGPDEPRYAAIGHQMALSGDWITPRLWGEPWFEKPALLYWMTATGTLAGLGPELAPRVPLAILSLWFLVFYYLRMRREFGERAAWISTGMLATSAGWLAFSHVAVTEVPLSIFFASSMLLALPWIRSGGRRGLIVGGALLGLAILAKGLVPVVLSLPLYWVGRRRWRDLLAFSVTAVAVAAPWYIACYARNGWPFFETFFLKHHLSRFVRADLQHVQPWWFYLPVLAGLLFPWTPALAVLRTTGWREPRRQLLLGWLAFGLLFFSVSTNKLPGYVMPLLPALTALIGIQLAAAPTRFILPLSALMLTLTPVAATVLPEAVASGLSRASAEGIVWPAVAAIALAAAGIALAERRAASNAFPVAFAATFLLTAACMAGLIAAAFPGLDRVASARPAWETMRTRPEPSRCLPETLHRSQRYGLNYYAGRELPTCATAPEEHHDILDRDKGKSR